MTEAKKCPKCGGEMVDGRFLFLWGGAGNRIRDIVTHNGIHAYCSKCGFIELYEGYGRTQEKRE